MGVFARLDREVQRILVGTPDSEVIGIDVLNNELLSGGIFVDFLQLSFHPVGFNAQCLGVGGSVRIFDVDHDRLTLTGVFIPQQV
jgi:hypothetical protein